MRGAVLARAIEPGGYRVTFQDNFATLDTAVWKYGYAGETNPKGSAAEPTWLVDPTHAGWNGYTPFSTGANGLTITARRTTTVSPPGGALAGGQVPTDANTGSACRYLSGMLNTKGAFSFRSGIVDVWHGLITDTPASWPSMWTRPVTGVNGMFPEVDVAEPVGYETGTSHQGLVEAVGNVHAILTVTGGNLFPAFHFYRAVITDYAIAFYLDGVLTGTVDISAKPAMQAALYLLFDYIIGSYTPSWVPQPDVGVTTPDTCSASFRCVRVLQKPGPDSLDLSATGFLDSQTPGALATISSTSVSPSTSPAYTVEAGGSGKFSISGSSLSASQALAAGSYAERLKVTDAQGNSWRRLFNLLIVADNLGTNIWTFPTSLANAAWTKFDITVTGGQADPTGGTTAELLLEDNANTSHGFLRTFTKAAADHTYQFAVDLKPNGRTAVNLFWAKSDFATAVSNSFVDISTGVVTGPFNADAATVAVSGLSVVDLGNNWKRVLGTVFIKSTITTAVFQCRFTNDGTTTTYVGDVTKGFVSRTKLQLVQTA